MLRFRVLGASCFGLRFRVLRFRNYLRSSFSSASFSKLPNYFSVVFVTRVNFAGASFTRRHVKRAFQSVFLVNLFFNYYEYDI